MNKEQFLAMSLPYGLKISHFGQINTLNIHNYNAAVYCPHKGQWLSILRPITDLTKEIEQNGEKFVPIDKILEEACFDLSKMNRDEINSYSNPILMPELISLTDALMLIEWHFDIACLIEKCEAIDVNTLDTNPYK